jgi:hypothetical protein
MQARATLEEFEASIGRDTVKHPPADGTVHPLTAYTLSFLKRLFAYEATVDTLFGDAANEVPLCSAHNIPCHAKTTSRWLHVDPSMHHRDTRTAQHNLSYSASTCIREAAR